MGNTSSHQSDTLSSRVAAAKSSVLQRRFGDAERQINEILDQHPNPEKDSDIAKNIAKALSYRAYAYALQGYSERAVTDGKCCFSIYQ